MTHLLTMTFAGHTYAIRFAPHRFDQVQRKLSQLGFLGFIPWDMAFDKAREAREMMDQPEINEMDEFERMVERLRKQGFYVQLHKRDSCWTCRLFCRREIAWRPPEGEGETALKALAAADMDRFEVQRQVPAKK